MCKKRDRKWSCAHRRAGSFQVKRTRPGNRMERIFFPSPSPNCIYQFLRIFIGNGERGWDVSRPVRGPRRVNPASGLSTRSFLPCVSKRKRGEEESRREKRKRGGRGASLNASRQNSLNARESSCRCRFSPFSPLLPPLPFLFFPLHDVCRLFHLANPAVPLHRHPISAPRESTLRTSAAVAPCPRLSPIIPRQRKTKRRRNKYSPGRKQPPGEREGLGSPTFDDVLFFPISNTLFLLPFFSLDLWRKILSRFMRFSLLPAFVAFPPRGFYERASSIFINFLIFNSFSFFFFFDIGLGLECWI